MSSLSAESAFDPPAVLEAAFYRGLEALHEKVAHWEATAPPTERMTAARLSALWTASCAELEASGAPAVDLFGRPVTLRSLPPELLELLEPRWMVTDARRLPEDVENWPAWVAREAP